MSQRRAWRFIDGAVLTALVAAALFSSWPVWVDICTIALSTEEQSHIFLAIPVALWLFWVRRERLRWAAPKWTLLGPAVALVGLFLASLSYERGVELGFHFGGLMMVFGAALTVFGVDFVRRFMPAFAALLFLLPIPGRIRQQVSIPLQEASARITHLGLELFGVPSLREGNVLVINDQSIAVAEACNGMRMVSALALVAFAFVFSVPMRLSVRLLILAISPLVALACNVIRLTPTALMYGYAEAGAAKLFHDVSGWAVLFAALGMLWGFLSLLRWIEVPIAPIRVAVD